MISQTEPGRGPERARPEHYALPPLPGVVSRLLDALRAGTTNAGKVADLLSTDPALVAQVLKMVNSAYFGLPRRIAEIKHAVAYLGLAEIERLVLTAGVFESFATDDEATFERYWAHSFYTALVSKLLARRVAPSLDPGELYTAALLHDVGKLVMLKFEPERYATIDCAAREAGCQFIEAERTLGSSPDHLELGAALCESWRLPEQVADACRTHDDPHAARERGEAVRLVCLANLLATLAAGELGEEAAGRLRERATSALGFEDSDFLLLMGEVYELRTEVDAFLDEL